MALWTASRQAPLSMGFFRQEYWRGWPFPSPGDLPDPGTEPTSPVSAGRLFTAEPPGKPSGGVRAALPCLSASGLTSLPPGAWCLVVFHSLSCLSSACCCVSTSQLGSCQDKPAGGPLTPVSLPGPRLMRLSTERNAMRLDSPESLGNQAVKTKRLARVLSHFSFSPLARVSGHL